jgi:hypothetical protein
MPEIDLIPVPLYEPLQPYQFEFDNMPLQALMTRMELINFAVDINSQILRDSIGTQGTLSNRLNQSLNPDGTLRQDRVDQTLHHIGAHTDGIWDDISYVRFTFDERAKLQFIHPDATNMSLEFQTLSNILFFDQGPLLFEPSPEISWQVDAPNRISARLNFPLDAAHRHFYDIRPQPATPLAPDYINYITGLPNPFQDGSLRVYINGVRLSSEDQIYAPGALVNSPWILNRFTPNPDNTGFSLDRAITAMDSIRIDFDIGLV